jgi:hypothetical protein
MSAKAREFIDFWIETSVHAAEQYGVAGGEQDVTQLARRFVQAAKGQGISEADMQAEIGDVAEYIRGKLKAANKAESDRHQLRLLLLFLLCATLQYCCSVDYRNLSYV